MHIRLATKDDVGMIRQIATITWPVAYGHILSKEQLDYMLDWMYNQDALTHAIASNTCQFYIAENENKIPIGFAGFRPHFPEQNRYRLDKLYVLPDHQGQGIGKAMIYKICSAMKSTNARVLELNVNRNNNAKLFYERLGFSIARTEDIDIGNGFFMNDYVMELDLD